jgi:hypothetical protein
MYVVIGYGFHYLNWTELFPMYSWELYSYVPARERIDFGLLITSINGEPLPEPVYFEEAEGLISEAHSIVAIASIQEFAGAILREDESEAARIRGYIESLYFDEIESVGYQIIRRRADLLDLWEGAEYDEETVIATFEK